MEAGEIVWTVNQRRVRVHVTILMMLPEVIVE